MPRPFTFRYARVAVLVMLLAGCAPQPARTPAGPALTAGAGDLISRTGTYYQDQDLLQRTENRLADGCLAAAGFTVDTTRPGSADEEWRPVLAERQAGGYRLRASQEAEAESPAGRYVRALPAERQDQFLAAMNGDAQQAITLRDGQQFTFPSTGCLAEARTTVFGDPAQAARIDYLAQNYHNTAYLAAIAQPAYRTALTAWSACMRAEGHDFASPSAAKQSLAAEYPPDAPATASPHEIAVAVADAGCATRAGVPGTVESLLRDHAAGLDETGIAELNALADLRAQAVARAGTLS
ncbi:hypothetical protein ACIA8K_19360 [Catenuloplanes sp. NPDC051500]|uniref:hypothetical protein n=1 Tax=Catenuloplanes sp. NPDC051500 TaxID=3363959 RepID=UPI0037901F5A